MKISIHLTDPRHRETPGKVRARYLRDARPAITLVVAAALAEPDDLPEIEAVAVVAERDHGDARPRRPAAGLILRH